MRKLEKSHHRRHLVCAHANNWSRSTWVLEKIHALVIVLGHWTHDCSIQSAGHGATALRRLFWVLWKKDAFVYNRPWAETDLAFSESRWVLTATPVYWICNSIHWWPGDRAYSIIHYPLGSVWACFCLSVYVCVCCVVQCTLAVASNITHPICNMMIASPVQQCVKHIPVAHHGCHVKRCALMLRKARTSKTQQ